MSDLLSEKKEMSAVTEASALVQRVAEPRVSGDSIKAAIVRSARRLGFSFTRTRDLWYANARRINSEEMDRLREQAGRVEARMAINNMVVLRQRLATTDQNFYREAISHLDGALRAMGADVCPLVIPAEEESE